MPTPIRSAVLNDVPAILAIERRTPGAAHWTAKQYNQRIDDASGVVLVAGPAAVEAGQICGFICARIVAGEWEIENVAVPVEFGRRGIASELVGTLLRAAKSEGATSILLEVRESNVPARRLYENHGFREVGRRRAYYLDPAEEAILYALRFDR